jgi:predicted transcriptional regulator
MISEELKMAKPRFRLISSIPSVDETDEALKEYHSSWRRTLKNSNSPFVPIFTGFRETHLSTLEPGALRLYLYFAFAAHNEYGSSWHSIETIADYFNTRTRTVNNWIKILVDKNLIYREQKGKRSHTTYLIPYSNTIIKHHLKKDFKKDNQDLLGAFIQKITEYEFLYGTILEVFHFFQWKTDEKKKPIREGQHWLFVITKRPDGVLTAHNISLKNSNDFGVNALVIEDGDIGTFASPFKYQGKNVRGLVLTHEIKLINSNAGPVLQLIEDLAKAESWDWDEHPKFEYGKITDLIPEEDSSEEEKTPDQKQEATEVNNNSSSD